MIVACRIGDIVGATARPHTHLCRLSPCSTHPLGWPQQGDEAMSKQTETRRLVSQLLNGLALAAISGMVIVPAANGHLRPLAALLGITAAGLCHLLALLVWRRAD
jgi:hypothetical protein